MLPPTLRLRIRPLFRPPFNGFDLNNSKTDFKPSKIRYLFFLILGYNFMVIWWCESLFSLYLNKINYGS